VEGTPFGRYRLVELLGRGGRIVGPPQVLTRSKLASVDPAARMAAWKAGQLESLGVWPYRPVKRTGH
jgi:hypothetical protein